MSDKKDYLFYQQPPDYEAGAEEPAPEGISEKEFALETLERYAGCGAKSFKSNLLLTNFPHYVDCFAEMYKTEVHEGSMFKVAHAKEEDVTILDFKIGSPAAALVIDLCSFLPIRANLLLGMCGGLRRRYKVGDLFLPVASIRDVRRRAPRDTLRL